VPVPPFASLASGAAGVAYFLLRHSRFGGGEASLQAAASWAAQAERAAERDWAFTTPAGPLSSVPGNGLLYHLPGVWWVRALVAASQHDHGQVRQAAGRFADAAAQASHAPWDVGWGAAGMLLGCAQLLETLEDDAVAIAPVRAAGDMLALELSALADRDGAKPDETTLGYLGAAHGWAGVAHALLRWSVAISGVPPGPVLALLERLVELRRPSGRWPLHAGSRVVWLGWCHGSAGWAQLWALAGQVTGDHRLLGLAEFCVDDALANADVNDSLCCGRAGQGFAALTLYRASGERHWLAAAERVAATAACAATDDDAPAHSLFSGELGVALLATELEDPDRSGMPVYEMIA
jgi:hypothetical protein